MHVTRGRVQLVALVVAGFLAWTNLSRSAQETAVLRIPESGRHDLYVNVWVADDGGRLWIRAESPERVWLESLRREPVIELQRESGTRSYRAVPLDRDGVREYVDPLFRAKYGLADAARDVLGTRHTVPIRLEAL